MRKKAFATPSNNDADFLTSLVFDTSSIAPPRASTLCQGRGCAHCTLPAVSSHAHARRPSASLSRPAVSQSLTAQPRPTSTPPAPFTPMHAVDVPAQNGVSAGPHPIASTAPAERSAQWTHYPATTAPTRRAVRQPQSLHAALPAFARPLGKHHHVPHSPGDASQRRRRVPAAHPRPTAFLPSPPPQSFPRSRPSLARA
ncbi:hypothetical protein MSAN_00916300 [Mycena sanguinolenta]|uniref:Uncharacterized protein n=1 Tax=Mycena sanguinolenta TaxID=230812 RepID=A0A8H6YSW6_9AGAR|nr:hypothetical protein MSAN_00916300 [Mycena sanguinolenta]